MDIIIEIIIKIALFSLVFFLIFYSVKSSAKRGKLRYGKWLLWLGAISLATGIALIYFVLIKRNIDIALNLNFISFIFVLLLFIIGGIYAIAEYFLTQGEFNYNELKFKSTFKKKKNYKLSDIKNVKYDPTWQWCVIEFHNGDKLRLHEYLSGLDEFIEILQKRGFNFE